MCTVLSNNPYMLNVRFTYSTSTLFTLPFSNFLFKFRKTHFSFFGTRFYIWGPLYVTVSVPYFAVLLFVEYNYWKFLRLYLLFLIMKASFIIGGDKPVKNLYISLARLSMLIWCNVFSFVISRRSWKERTWSLWVNLRAHLWNRLIRLFKEREQNIHISGQ